MMISSSPQEVGISAQGHVAFTCPYCRTSRTASVARYRNLHAPITVECDCEQLFDILIDTRQFYRQHLQLHGAYVPLGSTVSRRITVQTLSASGISFHTMFIRPIRVDEEVTLWFHLDDVSQTLLRLRAVVRWVQDETVGAEFCEGHAHEQDLDSYLRFASGRDKPQQKHL